jgi:hypothetical protein
VSYPHQTVLFILPREGEWQHHTTTIERHPTGQQNKNKTNNRLSTQDYDPIWQAILFYATLTVFTMLL